MWACDLAAVLLLCFNCCVVRNKRCEVLSFSIPEHLWECLEQASGKPIAAVMNSWTKQMGFPIIVVDQEQVTFTDPFSSSFLFWFFCFVVVLSSSSRVGLFFFYISLDVLSPKVFKYNLNNPRGTEKSC